MNRLQFWILNVTSLLLALAIGLEMYLDHQLDVAQDRRNEVDLSVARLQQMRPFAQQLLQRAAIAGQHDPAILARLESYGFHFTAKTSAPPPIVPAPPLETPTPIQEMLPGPSSTPAKL